MFDWLPLDWRELLDIGLVAFVYYRLILLVKGTRAVPVMYGLVLVLVIYYVSGELGLYTLNWFLANFLGSIFLVIIILFQQDIRKALAQMGAGGFWHTKAFSSRVPGEILRSVAEAASTMGRLRIGALIVLERKVPLGDIVERGVAVDAKVSNELLVSIFYPNAPLHDGAVIIRGRRIVAASCILPLTPATDVAVHLGTRHRAALGITEDNDCVVVVVSEERGEISLALGGNLSTGYGPDELFERLVDLMK